MQLTPKTGPRLPHSSAAGGSLSKKLLVLFPELFLRSTAWETGACAVQAWVLA